jgi:hypothetical protein
MKKVLALSVLLFFLSVGVWGYYLGYLAAGQGLFGQWLYFTTIGSYITPMYLRIIGNYIVRWASDEL